MQTPPQTPETPFRLSQIKHPVLWAGLFMIAAIYLRGILLGRFGQIGVDSDDVMRLVQIRDYLEGQGWFNTDQLRLGVMGGTDMHWSRLVDLPMIGLAHFFDIFTDSETALMWAISVWPPLTAGIFIYGIAKAAKYYSRLDGNETANKTNLAFSLILLGFFAISFFRFEPGAIDHHNIQMGCVALAMAGGLDPQARFKTHFLAGVATALSVAIGTEVYIFAGAICAYMAINWLIQGASASRAAQGFGLGLASALLAAFFTTISPAEYTAVKCDSLSLITLSAGVAGGLGLALTAKLTSDKPLKLRLAACAMIAAVCAVIFALQGPQCMANPLAEIPDDVKRLWLDEVQEARPLWSVGKDWLEIIPFTLGPALLGLYVLVQQLRRDRVWSPRWLILFLLVSSTLLSVYQVRFGTFSYVFALVPLAAWVAGMYARGKAKAEATENGSNVAYIGALALSIPLVWLLPAFASQSAPNAEDTPHDMASNQVAACYSEAVMAGLNTLPFGTIASTSNGGSKILLNTPHRSLSGNYHRNIEGISAQIHLASSEPEKARAIITRAGVDYVHFCKASPETNNLVKENANGLYAHLLRGEVPSYLDEVLILEEGGVIIYKVN